MKKRYIFSFLLAGATLVTSCTKNFDEINTDPNQTTIDLLNPNFLMSQSQMLFSQTGYDQLLFQAGWVQGLASTYDYYGNGDKYILRGSGRDYYSRTWNAAYTAIGYIEEMKNLIKGDASKTNLDACGTILKVLYMQRITDLYGDAPFAEAGKGKIENITKPKFDKQQDIYMSMLTQLEAATKALDASKDKPTIDLFYGGEIAQWKKFGYSLMLRVAMRLTEVDKTTAEKYAVMAYNGGTMSAVGDDAVVLTDAANGNQNSSAGAYLTSGDFRELKWSKRLIDYMKTTGDPRIPAIAEIAVGNGTAANDAYVVGDNTASKQQGMPNGYDLLGGETDISKAPGYPGATPADPDVEKDVPAPLGKYSRPRFAVYGDRNAANIVLTYGESELLLAEAATRGWATGSAAEHYKNALGADMKVLARYNKTPIAIVSDPVINIYVDEHPLVAATAMEQINMEHWVLTCTIFDFNEAYANYRRTGIPNLEAVDYPNQYYTGGIPNRMPYPITLPQTNAANYQAAVTSMGGDDFGIKVWWDK